MKKAIIKACTFLKSFSSDHGTFYSHNITLSNGDTGQINAKDENPPFLQEGQALYYTITENGKYAPKIKRVSDKKQIEAFDKANGGTEPKQNNNLLPLKLIEQVNTLSHDMEQMKEVVKQLVKHTKMVYIAPKEPVGKYEQEIANAPAPYDDQDLPF